jgi:hypothetical protein
MTFAQNEIAFLNALRHRAFESSFGGIVATKAKQTVLEISR